MEVHHQGLEKLEPRVGISRMEMLRAKTEVLHVNLVYIGSRKQGVWLLLNHLASYMHVVHVVL